MSEHENSGLPATHMDVLPETVSIYSSVSKSLLFSIPTSRNTTTLPRAMVARPVAPENETVAGKVERVVFRTPSNGFTVVSLLLDNGSSTTVQAYTSQIFRINQNVVASGRWKTYKGRAQFRAETIIPVMPREAKAVMAWIVRNVAGIGVAGVNRLYDCLGDSIVDAIENCSVLVDAGLEPALAQAVVDARMIDGGMGDLELQLVKLGLKPRQVVKVIECFGPGVLAIARTNPWLMVDIEGIGFPTADDIALQAGLDMESPVRLRAGLLWVLNECLNRQGHCGLKEENLVLSAITMLDLSKRVVEDAMEDFLGGDVVVRDNVSGLIYPISLLEAEENAAEHLASLVSCSRGGIGRTEAMAAVLRAECDMGVELDRDGGQFEAAVVSLCNPVCIITGGPGTGKSTAQAVIVKARSYSSNGNCRIMLAAPTGRAARRLSETSRQKAQTIHRMLAFNQTCNDFEYNENKPLELDACIVDEISMVDIRLFCSLVQAMPANACLTLVGDVDQLPSVGPGQVLRDLIESKVIPVVCLTRIHRQAAGSGVAIAAQRINTGLVPMNPQERMRGFSITSKSDHAIVSEIVRVVRFVLPEQGFDPMRDVQVLAAMRGGHTGVEALNTAIKNALNPAEDNGLSVRMPLREFTVGDRVMQLRNDYNKGVYNGEVGTVNGTGTEPHKRATRPWLSVDFSGVEARYTPEDADNIDLAYAATVHKIQGCEAPVVIFAFPQAHKRMLSRQLFYTGVTRAKIDCRIIGHHETINAAPMNNNSGQRNTGLRQRLQAAIQNTD